MGLLVAETKDSKELRWHSKGSKTALLRLASGDTIVVEVARMFGVGAPHAIAGLPTDPRTTGCFRHLISTQPHPASARPLYRIASKGGGYVLVHLPITIGAALYVKLVGCAREYYWVGVVSDFASLPQTTSS